MDISLSAKHLVEWEGNNNVWFFYTNFNSLTYGETEGQNSHFTFLNIFICPNSDRLIPSSSHHEQESVSLPSSFLFSIFYPIVNMKIEMEHHVAHANWLLNNGMASTVLGGSQPAAQTKGREV